MSFEAVCRTMVLAGGEYAVKTPVRGGVWVVVMLRVVLRREEMGKGVGGGIVVCVVVQLVYPPKEREVWRWVNASFGLRLTCTGRERAS